MCQAEKLNLVRRVGDLRQRWHRTEQRIVAAECGSDRIVRSACQKRRGISDAQLRRELVDPQSIRPSEYYLLIYKRKT